MPKFAPNTGFKMPGVGSKNIDSPGNFRDEQHVDKVGYCDNTEERMLPEGSSPLKVRYTTTGYRKDLKVLDFPTGKKKEEEPKREEDKVKKVKKVEKQDPPELTAAREAFGDGAQMEAEAVVLKGKTLKAGTDKRKVIKKDKTKFTPEGTAAYNAKSLEEQKAQDARELKRIENSKTTVEQERGHVIVDGKKIPIGEYKNKEA